MSYDILNSAVGCPIKIAKKIALDLSKLRGQPNNVQFYEPAIHQNFATTSLQATLELERKNKVMVFRDFSQALITVVGKPNQSLR